MHSIRPLVRSLAAVFALAALSSHAAVTLQPLVAGAATPGAASAGGLAGTWYKLDNNARFSTYEYTDENGRTDQIQNFGWGTGIWAASDIAAIAAGQNPYVTATAHSVGQVSYANNIYNNTQMGGAYGTWGEDYVRALAPIVGGANGCPLETEALSLAHCGGEVNYAAVFTGYLYVAMAGTYDFAVFADDGFNFSLSGKNGSLSMDHNTVVGSQGRDLYELVAENNLDALYLQQGYYQIDLSYFNRLEAGVIDLGWRGPGATIWTSIDGDNLYHVPEPGTLALMALALAGLWGARRRQAVAGQTR